MVLIIFHENSKIIFKISWKKFWKFVNTKMQKLYVNKF